MQFSEAGGVPLMRLGGGQCESYQQQRNQQRIGGGGGRFMAFSSERMKVNYMSW